VHTGSTGDRGGDGRDGKRRWEPSTEGRAGWARLPPLGMIRAGGAVEVGVAAIHINELAGGVAAARGGEEHDGVGHFLWSGHAMAEGDELLDGGAGAGGVVEGIKPSLILGCDAFGGEHAVHTDMVRRERDGPFAGESVHGTLSGGVSGGLALTGGGDFGADVDDGALVADEFFAAKMREGVNVRKIQVHGSHEFFRGGLQIFAVVVARIVDEDINTAVGGQGFLHHALAGSLFGEFGFDKEAVDFLSQGVAFGRAAAGDDNIRAFGSKRSNRGCSDALGTAGDDYGFVGKAQIHKSD